jgi:hypothetical protein
MEEKSAALERIFELHAFRVGEPRKRKVAVILTDTAVRQRSERILRESDARLPGLLAGIAQASWEADRSARSVDDAQDPEIGEIPERIQQYRRIRYS